MPPATLWLAALNVAYRDGRILEVHGLPEVAPASRRLAAEGVLDLRATVQEAMEALLKSESECVPVTVRRKYVGAVTLATVQNAIGRLRTRARWSPPRRR